MSTWTSISSLLCLTFVIGIIIFSITRGYGWVPDAVNDRVAITENIPVVVQDSSPQSPDFEDIPDITILPSPSIIPHYLYSHSEQTRTI